MTTALAASADGRSGGAFRQTDFPWNLVLAWFMGSVSLWILTGFLQRPLSLTVILFPVILAALVGQWLAALTLRDGIVIPREERPLAWLAGLLVVVTVASWAVSGLMLRLPLKARVFNLVLPLGVALLLLGVWTVPLTSRAAKRLLTAFLVCSAVNGLASALTFVTFNVLQLLPNEIFYLNDRYPVILFHAAGRGLVRTPGLFETGGSNGTFLLLLAVPLLSWLLFAPGRPGARRVAWATLASAAALIAMTLTRRSVLALVCTAAVLLAWHALRARRFRYVFGLAVVGVAAALAVLARAPELATAETLLIRLGHWQANVSDLFGARPLHLATGFGVLQASLEMIPGSTFRILDNTVLELVLYGGVPLLAVMVTMHVILLALNVHLARTLPPERQWLPIAVATLLVAIAIIGMFTPFIYSVTESIPALLGVHVATKRAMQWVREDRTSAPALAAA